MSERSRHTTALRTAIDGFAERAQFSGGLLRSVDAMSRVLVDGKLRDRDASHHEMASPLRVVAVMSRLHAKESPFLVAVLGGQDLTSPLLASAEVTQGTAHSPQSLTGERLQLPVDHLNFIQKAVEMAKPQYVEPTEAELLYQRATGYLALN